MFVPYSQPSHNYPTADEIAKAILDEKERRDKERSIREYMAKKEQEDDEMAENAAADIIRMLIEEGQGGL